MPEILPRDFYARPTVAVAQDLLGTVLVHGGTAGRIVETEAYLDRDEFGRVDAAAHSAAGITARTRVIFGPPGHAYVYLSYGLHACMNIVAESEGKAGCVLIRALEPLAGIDLMQSRRPAAKTIRDLANGPGKLTSALAITLGHSGVDLTIGDLTVRKGAPAPPGEIAVSPRIGISKAVDWPLRFFLRDNPYASAAKPQPDRRAPSR